MRMHVLQLCRVVLTPLTHAHTCRWHGCTLNVATSCGRLRSGLRLRVANA